MRGEALLRDANLEKEIQNNRYEIQNQQIKREKIEAVNKLLYTFPKLNRR